MNVTKSASLNLGAAAATSRNAATAARQRPASSKAMMGGGWITTPAVAAHLRKTMVARKLRSV